jgi:Nickel responsive protein SCO4226-like
MAECFWPGVTRLLLQDAGRRGREAAQALTSQDACARYIGSILVPADETAFCLFEASSIETATEINQRAAIPYERILEVVRLDPVIRRETQ